MHSGGYGGPRWRLRRETGRGGEAHDAVLEVPGQLEVLQNEGLRDGRCEVGQAGRAALSHMFRKHTLAGDFRGAPWRST